MCPTPIGVQVRDQAIVYRVEIEKDDGTPLASGEAEATPHCPTDDPNQAAFCASICSG